MRAGAGMAWHFLGKEEKVMTQTRDGWKKHEKTMWPGDAGANEGGHDNRDRTRLQTVSRTRGAVGCF